MSKLAHWFRKSSKNHRSRARRTRPPARLSVESLEERTVPTIVFLPKYGPEGFADNHGTRLSDVPVYLIFWGSYWKKTTTDTNGSTPTVNEITSDVQSILGGNYLKLLTQYGVNGSAHLAGTYFDTSDWSSGSFDFSDVAHVADGLQDGGGLPEADDLSTTPLYVVVTPPHAQLKESSAASKNGMQHDDDPPYTDVDQIPLIWLGGLQPNGIPQNGTVRDWYSTNFSHELAEAITDIGGDAIRVSPNPAFTNKYGQDATGQEIGDNEAEFNTYRLNGVLTQSLWSKNNGAYAVSDGTTQQFIVTNGILLVQGDQGGVRDDTITLDVAASGPSKGGVRVTLNGEVAQFEPGQITSIQVYTGGGNDTVNVEAVPAGVSVALNKQGSGPATLNVSPGAHEWGNIQSDVTVYSSTPGTWSVNVYDQAHPYAETYGINTFSLRRTNAGTFTSFFGSVGSVTLYAGYSANTIDVPGLGRTLDSFIPLMIDGGGFSTVVADDRSNPAVTTYTLTPGALARAAAGQPLVTINYAHVRQFTVNAGSGPDLVVMDDRNNPDATTYTVTATSLARSDATNGASATINFAQVTGLTLNIGSGTDVVNVESTPLAMTIVGGAGADTFNVAPSSQKLDGINGILSFQAGRGGATLTVNDQANPFTSKGPFSPSTSYVVAGSSLTRTVFFPVTHGQSTTTITYAGLTNVTLNAANNAPNSVDVESTSILTTVVGGAATGQINVTPTAQNLDSIVGGLIVSGLGALNVYDQANPHGAATGVPNSYDVYSGVSRSVPYTKGAKPTTVGLFTFFFQGSLTLYTSTQAPNLVRVHTVEGPTTINSGAADAITVTAFSVPILSTLSGTQVVSDQLTINAHGGTLVVDDTATQNDTLNTFSDAFTITDQAVVQKEHWSKVVHRIKDREVPINPKFPPPPDGTTLNAYFTYGLNYTNVTSLVIDGGPISSSFNVQSTPLNVPVTVFASAASQFTVGANGTVKNIRSQLTLTGSGTSSTVLVDDSQATALDNVTVTPTQVLSADAKNPFFATGGSLTYGGMSALTLTLSHSAGDKVLLTPSATTAFFINGDPSEFQAGLGAELDLALAGVTDAVLTSTGRGAGNCTFRNNSHKAVTFSNMRAVQTR
jgi:hypothetical protein